jgi:hypothetical protein
MVNVRADNLEDIAEPMASDNIGLNPVNGHVAVLRRTGIIDAPRSSEW